MNKEKTNVEQYRELRALRMKTLYRACREFEHHNTRWSIFEQKKLVSKIAPYHIEIRKYLDNPKLIEIDNENVIELQDDPDTDRYYHVNITNTHLDISLRDQPRKDDDRPRYICDLKYAVVYDLKFNSVLIEF